MIDHFYQLAWRRLNAKFKPETLDRHYIAILSALLSRRERIAKSLEKVQGRKALMR